jgi:hypothetical protein
MATVEKITILLIDPSFILNLKKEVNVPSPNPSIRSFMPITAMMERNGKTGRIYRTCLAVKKYAMMINKTENITKRNLSLIYLLLSNIKGENTIRIGFSEP